MILEFNYTSLLCFNNKINKYIHQRRSIEIPTVGFFPIT